MDEILDQFGSTVIGENVKSNFESYYKNRGRSGNQDERRKDLLETQKDGRNHRIDCSRGILDLVKSAEDNIFHTPKTHYRPTVYVAGYQALTNYANVLMCSEWMYEKPHDFAENWLLVPCPKGVRMLAVANRGKTKFFNKFGHFRFECRTALPGGNPCDTKSNIDICVLDCFYVKESQTVYVLDILAWNNCVMTDGEASFRQYWMVSHLEVIPELQMITDKNEVCIKLLPKIPCTTENLNEFLSKYPYFPENQPALDGLLFYHSQAHYWAGETPLVGWLYPYMLPEVIGPEINLNVSYEIPAGYTNYLDFIEKFEAKNAKKPKKKVFPTRNNRRGDNADLEDMEDENAHDQGDNQVTAADNMDAENAQGQGDNQVTAADNMDAENAQGQGDTTTGPNNAKEAGPNMEEENAARKDMESMVSDILSVEK